MRWGYNWEMGPFQVWDALGFCDTYDRMVKPKASPSRLGQAMRESGAKSFYKRGEVYDLSTGMYTEAAADDRARPACKSFVVAMPPCSQQGCRSLGSWRRRSRRDLPDQDE